MVFSSNVQQELKNIDEQVNSLQTQVDFLRKENSYLKSEKYKDLELSKMEKLVDLYRSRLENAFTISSAEQSRIDKWQIEHIKEKHWDKDKNQPLKTGAVGGRFSYNFLPTSIGIIGTCKCHCGEEFTFHEID